MSTLGGRLVRSFAAIAATFGVLSGAAIVLAPATALAYNACNSGSSGSVSSSTSPGGSTVDFTATFKDCNGNAVAGVQVTFSQVSGPGNCKVTFSSTTGVTGPNGQVTVSVTLPPNCPGQYILGAATQGAQVQATLVETGGFPNTTAPAGPAAPSRAWLLAAAVGALLTVVSAGALLRSFRPQP